MNDGSSTLRKVYSYSCEKQTLETFLNLLGMAYTHGRFISNRNVEVFISFSFFYIDIYVRCTRILILVAMKITT